MNFLLWKSLAILKGAWILKTAKRSTAIVGTCMPNGEGDISAANKINSQYYRIGLSEAIKLETLDKPYALLMEKLDDNGNRIPGSIVNHDSEWYEMLNELNKWLPRLKVKTNLVLLQNEQNEISHSLEFLINEYMPKTGHSFIKGPWTCCVERAGLELYKKLLGSDQVLHPIHAFNFYLKPSWENKTFENYQRKCLIAYLTHELRKKGVKYFIITEAHAGSRTKPGYYEQGDYVYCDKADWLEIVDLAERLDINVLLYYCAPFLNYDGNTVGK